MSDYYAHLGYAEGLPLVGGLDRMETADLKPLDLQ